MNPRNKGSYDLSHKELVNFSPGHFRHSNGSLKYQFERAYMGLSCGISAYASIWKSLK